MKKSLCPHSPQTIVVIVPLVVGYLFPFRGLAPTSWTYIARSAAIIIGYPRTSMSKKPPLHELEFLKQSGNHLELARRLSLLGFSDPDLVQYTHFICEAWFHLGEEHLKESKNMLRAGCSRAVFSRSYYAAYNASKGARYLIGGFVSLKGDDHGKASTDLPGDFPDIANWSRKLSTLYEHRLHADYDNWSTTSTEFTLTPADAILFAEQFIEETRTYLNSKTGIAL